MTSFCDVIRNFPIYSHTMTSSDQSADVSTNMTSYQMFCIFLRVLRLLYYHTKPQSSYLISVGFRQGGQYCPPPPCQIRGSRTPCQIGFKAPYSTVPKYCIQKYSKHQEFFILKSIAAKIKKWIGA